MRENGIRPAWLAEQLGLHRVTVHYWLTGKQPVPEKHKARILKVLRERQALPVDRDLFETTMEGS